MKIALTVLLTSVIHKLTIDPSLIWPSGNSSNSLITWTSETNCFLSAIGISDLGFSFMKLTREWLWGHHLTPTGGCHYVIPLAVAITTAVLMTAPLAHNTSHLVCFQVKMDSPALFKEILYQ